MYAHPNTSFGFLHAMPVRRDLDIRKGSSVRVNWLRQPVGQSQARR